MRTPLLLVSILALFGCGNDDDNEGSNANGGSSGGSGAPPQCVPAHRAMTLAIVGNQSCPEQETCIENDCADEFADAVGPAWESGEYAGACADYVACVEACDCESECSVVCRDEESASGSCLDAIIAVAECRNDACPTASESCSDY
jgi:hypothetical protein